MYFISSLAETNRVPFDLTEGESELVSGFNVEYSSMCFAMVFLAEYCHIILMGSIGALLFLGGGPYINCNGLISSVILGIKIIVLVFCIIWIRSTLPRIRYDQLMSLLWKSYLPFSLAFMIIVAGTLIGLKGSQS
jgi:NADH:ubiquinone oxidoreductase subunit H